MKKKIFSVLFALVLLASFSLVTAVPVAANPDPGTLEVEARDLPSITIDGAVTTEEWGDADLILASSDTYHLGVPGNALADISYDVYIESDDSNLYVAFKATDAPEGWDAVITHYGGEIFYANLYIDADNNDVLDGDDHAISSTWLFEAADGNWANPVDLGETPVEWTRSWENKVIEYKIPLSLLGINPGDTLAFATQAFGYGWYPEGSEWTAEAPHEHPEVYESFTLPPFATIQAAINAADPYDTINVAAGTYDESVSISTNNLIVKAQNRATTEGAAGNAIVSPASGNGFSVNADGVTIDGFEIANISGVGISFVGSDNIFQYNLIHDLAFGTRAPVIGAIDSYTLWEGGSDDNQILWNTIYNSSGAAISYGSGDTVGTVDTNVGGIISDNTMYNLGTVHSTADSIHIMNGKDFIVSRNNITGSATQYYGIDISIQDGDVADCGGQQILNNTVTGHVCSIFVWTIGTYNSANNLTISGNNLSGANYHGIVLSQRSSFGPISGSTISENIIYNNSLKGIILGPNVHDNVISNNTIKDNGPGIWYGDVWYDGAGIWIEGADNEITGNDILNNTLAGILVKNAAGNEAHFNNIVGNDIGVKNENENVFDATDNWWGSANGPGQDGANDVSANVAYSPWLGQSKDAAHPWIFCVDDVGDELAAGYIQTAINAATSGDTVSVAAGTYAENVVVDTSLTLQGEDRGTTVIKANVEEPVLTISASGVTVSGFTIDDDGKLWGLQPYLITVKANDTLLSDLYIIRQTSYPDRGGGVLQVGEWYAGGFDGFTFTNSIVDSAYRGVDIWSSSSNIVIQNVDFTCPGDCVLLLLDTIGATITENTFRCAPDMGVVIGGNSQDIEISDNHFLGSANKAIRLDGGGTMGDVDILRNEISGFNVGIHLSTEFGPLVIGVLNIQNNEFENNNIQILDAAEVLVIEDILPPNNKFDRAVVVDHASLLHTIWSSIQDAIDEATGGDTVIVAAGTYGEAVIVEKAVTLLGANAGNPGTGTRGDESIIAGLLTGGGLALITANNVTLDGFTIQGTGVVEGWIPGCVYITSGTGITIENNIIEFTGAEPAQSWGGIINSGSIGATIKNNIIRNFRLGVYLNPGAAMVISNNTIEGSLHCGIGVDSDAGVTITNNTLHNNSIGIEVFKANVTANYNDIYGNSEYGVWANTAVDATHNWWGHASGPIPPGTYESYGDKVSTNVDYEPWLLEEDGPSYDKTLALKDGWTLVSTDKEVASSAWEGTKDLADGIKISALKYVLDPVTGELAFLDATTADLEPLTALYVKTDGGGGAGINYAADGDPAFYSKDLEAGWNLIGIPSTVADTGGILSPLRYVTIGTQQVVGLTTLVSQGDYNQFTGDFYEATLTDGDWESLPELLPFDGYWANMEADETFEVIP